MGKNKDTVCLSLTEEVLKIVQVRGSGANAKLTHLVAQDVQGLASDQLTKTVQAAVKKFSVKSANLCCVVSPAITTSKNIEVPSTNAEEISSIVDLQASRHTPFSREEIQVGHINIGASNNYSKVLLVIGNRSSLKSQLSVFEKAGLKIKKVLFAPEGQAALFSQAHKLDQSDSPIALIDIDQLKTDFLISVRGKTVMARTIPVGKAHFTSVESKKKLIDELKKTIEEYQSEGDGQLPAKYFLTSEDAQNQELQASLKSELSWDTQIVSYVDCIKSSKGVLKQIAKFEITSFFDVIAAATNYDQSNVNLLPEEVQLQKSIEEQGKEIFKAAILGIMVLVLIASIFGLRIHFHNSVLSKMEKDYRNLREEVNLIKTQSRRVDAISEFLNSRMDSLDTINELYNKIPKDVYLTRILMEEDGIVNIQGVSETGSRVYKLNTTLKEAKLFKAADVKSKKAKKDRGKDAHAFEITLTLDNETVMDQNSKK